MFKISEQYGRGTERFLSQTFRDPNEAKVFIREKLEEQRLMGSPVIYRLYDFDELIETFDSTKADSNTSENNAQGGRGAGASFRPTPLNTTPRPTGMPRSWVKDDDDKEDK